MTMHSYRLLRKSPKPYKILKWSLGVLIFFIAFIIFIPWQQFSLGEGQVIAYSPTEREFQVNAPVGGRISRWYVNEGSIVKKGDPILLINDNDPKYMERLQLEKDAISLRIEAAKRAVDAGISNVNRQKKLYGLGINSKRQYELSQVELAGYQHTYLKAKIDEVNVNIRIARQQTQMVNAKVSGVIFRRLSGQESVFVKAGQIVARIVPITNSRAVELWISGRDIPFVRLKQTARLQFDGWPAVQFRGWPELAVGTFKGEVSFIDATTNNAGYFRVMITPTEKWPHIIFLRQGVLVHGWIQLGQVPLWFELWRQFNGFPPKSSPMEPSKTTKKS